MTNSKVSTGNDRTPMTMDHWGFCCSLAGPGTLTETPILCLCPLVGEQTLLFAGRKVRSCTYKAYSPLIPLQNQVGNSTIIGVNSHQHLIVKIILLG